MVAAGTRHSHGLVQGQLRRGRNGPLEGRRPGPHRDALRRRRHLRHRRPGGRSGREVRPHAGADLAGLAGEQARGHIARRRRVEDLPDRAARRGDDDRPRCGGRRLPGGAVPAGREPAVARSLLSVPGLPSGAQPLSSAATLKHRVHPGGCAAVAIACCIALPVAAIGAPVDTAGHAWVGDLAPLAESDFGYEQAAHLLERAGFGGTPAEIEELVSLGLEGAVARLVDYETIDDSALTPFDESGIWDPGMDPFPPSRAAAVRRARRHGRSLGVDVLPEGSSRPIQPVVDKFFYGLRSNVLETRRLALWWADRMVVTPRPLEEKMTLFWHDHFATSEVKVRDARKMHLQNRTLRTHATADFKSLVLAVMRDPAMLVYLDNRENVKDHPNENFGRELLELFTMGVGNYTEQDIREASRAFTGWTNDVLDFRFDADLHDGGPKTFLGREGNLGGEEVLDIILEQPATGEFIAGKVYRYLVREELDPALQVELGRRLRESGYELKALLRTILSSRDFYSPPSVATQIKSPVALFVSTYRKLGVPRAPTVPDMNSLAGRLGQQLLYPPNVAGWAGGRTWITPAT
ncbi:MAG: DUF1800 domain-containing protein, partial [Holophagales bacterium]|nr:DUF1800 domain-containing protein [Holophagales bacterium]